MKKQTNVNEIHELKCKRCGKVIVSLSESQANHNMNVHLLTCKSKEPEVKDERA